MIQTIPKLLLLCFLLTIGTDLKCQDQVLTYELLHDSIFSELIFLLENNDTIKLKTSVKAKQVICIDHYVDQEFCLVILEINNKGYHSYNALAAYECEGEWIQDYYGINIIAMQSGISCTHIHEVRAIDSDRLYIESQYVSETLDMDTFSKIEVQLGKNGLHIKDRSKLVGLHVYGLSNKEGQDKSPRPISKEINNH